MESKDIELQRFVKKASGYKKALSYSPNCRILEIGAILSVIFGYCDTKEIEIKDLRIVELFAGTGYLTKHLADHGFREIHAIEASNEMSINSDLNHKNVILHPIGKIEDIKNILNKIQPHIIVSIAGYHHLIKYFDDDVIDHDKSLKLQENVTDLCVKSLANDGLLLIVDIFEDELLEEIDFSLPFWSPGKIKFDKTGLFPTEEIRVLKNTLSLEDYVEKIYSKYFDPLKIKNPSLKWFREVVDHYSEIGHKDTALRSALVTELKKKYEVNLLPFQCPWIFNNYNEFRSFLITFWFLKLKEDKVTTVLNYAQEINGVYDLNDKRVSFGWSLAMIAITKQATISRSTFKTRLITLLSVLNVFTIGTFLVRHFTYLDQLFSLLEKCIFILVGIIIKELYDFKYKKT